MEISEFLVTGDGSETQVEIEGEFPITTNTRETSPWYLLVSEFSGNTYIVQIATGSNFNSLASQIGSVNSIFEPDQFHPTTMKIHGKGEQITVPAGYVDGDPKIMWSDKIDGRLNLRFADGIFDDVGGAFLYSK